MISLSTAESGPHLCGLLVLSIMLLVRLVFLYITFCLSTYDRDSIQRMHVNLSSTAIYYFLVFAKIIELCYAFIPHTIVIKISYILFLVLGSAILSGASIPILSQVRGTNDNFLNFVLHIF